MDVCIGAPNDEVTALRLLRNYCDFVTAYYVTIVTCTSAVQLFLFAYDLMVENSETMLTFLRNSSEYKMVMSFIS